MTGTMGVDITHKKNYGLIPLQVALKFSLYEPGGDQRDLGCLVPDDEMVLSKLVPKDPTNELLLLAVLRMHSLLAVHWLFTH